MNEWAMILRELERLYELETKARTLVHRHVRSVPAREMPIEDLIKETRLRCAEYDPEIRASVRAWAWGHALSPLRAEAQMWRYVRVHTALMWLSQMEDVPGWERVFGPPLMQREDVIRWLLTDWWTLRGVALRAMTERGME